MESKVIFVPAAGLFGIYYLRKFPESPNRLSVMDSSKLKDEAVFNCIEIQNLEGIKRVVKNIPQNFDSRL